MTTSVLTYNNDTPTSSIGQSYAASCDIYQELADKKQEQKDTIVLAGYGCGLSVSRDALVCKQGFTHQSESGPKNNQAMTLYRGVHGIKSIVILSDSGNISLDAIRWASSEKITVSIIDRDGSLQQTLTPEQTANANLRRKQYQADASKIAYRLICKKVQAQQELLANHPELPDSERALEIFSDSLKWLELPDLPRWNDIDYMRTFEGRLAKAYFEAIEGTPIKFEKAYSKLVPPHWKQVSTRTSPLSHNHGARHAVNPFHAILNFAYAVVESQVRQALVASGFDVACGFLHADKLYRDSLVYDVIELFRSSVDAQVLKLVTTTTFKKGDFIPMHDGSIRLNQQLARYVVAQCQIPQARIEEGVKWLKSLLD